MNEQERYRLEQWETMNAIKDTLQRVANEGKAKCKLCDYVAKGNSFGEILGDLGEHGTYFHSGYFATLAERTSVQEEQR